MKTVKILLSFMFLAVTMVYITGCNPEDNSVSLYKEGVPSDSTVHTVTSVVPFNTANPVSGVSVLKIDGTNFSANVSNMKVWIGRVSAQILSSAPYSYSTSTMYVKMPINYTLLKDTFKLEDIAVKVQKSGVNTFATKVLSNSYRGIVQPIKFADIDLPAGALTANSNGELFYNLNSSGAAKGVKKYNFNTKSQSDFLTISNQFTGIKMGPGNLMYGVTSATVVKFDGIALSKVTAVKSISNSNDLDFDASKNIWVVTRNGKICKLSGTNYSTYNEYSAPADVINYIGTVKYIQLSGKEYLYVTGFKGADYTKVTDAANQWKIVRFDVTGGVPDLTSATTIYRAPAIVTLTSLCLSKDGDVYVGTDSRFSPIVWVKPDGNFENLLYYDLSTNLSMLEAGITSLCSDVQNSKYIYALRTGIPIGLNTPPKTTILKIYVDKQGAPYYGRGDQ